VLNQYEFPTKEKLNLFDKLVTPVLHYSAEIWGQKFRKRIRDYHHCMANKDGTPYL